ncbi:MAG: hypothetical protein WD250_11170 [Egibacteraceae bacterium]
MRSPAEGSLPDEVVRVLARRGPLSSEELGEALGSDPDDSAWDDELHAPVDAVDRIVELGDERFADVVTLLGATTVTHRVTAAEAAGGYVELGCDLQPLVTPAELVEAGRRARRRSAHRWAGTR